MDKNTLSNYGWIVVMILCLSVLIALATPFGGYIKAGVENTLDGLFETQESAIDVIYNKTITSNELKEKGYEFYSTLSLAIEDANGLTTANADVEKENKETAIAGLKINEQKASIVLINDANETNIILKPLVDLSINLNKKTINLNNGAQISSTNNLTVKNGNINTLNSTYTIRTETEDTTLEIDKVTFYNETNGDFTKTTTRIINSYSNTTNISNINATVKSNIKTIYALQFNAGNTMVSNSQIKVENTGGTTCLGIMSQCNKTIVSNCQIDMETTSAATRCFNCNDSAVELSNNTFNIETITGKSYAFYASGVVNSIEINNTNMNSVAENAIIHTVYINGNPDNNVEINGGTFIADTKKVVQTSSCNAIVINNCGKVIVNSTKNNPIYAFGRHIGLQIVGRDNIENTNYQVNGGIYTGTDHCGYFAGNLIEIRNAKFYLTNLDKYESNDKSGLYFGAFDESGKTGIVNLYNCEIGNSDNQDAQYGIAAKKQGYYPPAEINLYDCIIHQGTNSIFSYNRANGPSDQTYTKFNLYGNTKLYYRDGSEVSKSDLNNAINTWKNIENIKTTSATNNTPYAKGSAIDINKIIGFYWDCPDANEDKNIENYITADANVYDYR